MGIVAHQLEKGMYLGFSGESRKICYGFYLHITRRDSRHQAGLFANRDKKDRNYTRFLWTADPENTTQYKLPTLKLYPPAKLFCFWENSFRGDQDHPLFSDNASNFKKARNILMSMLELCQSDPVQNFVFGEGEFGHFTPPASPTSEALGPT
ncbi:hypothetical protein TNIN_102211 [Trichonephila inaurata madagascariensis]|uniref:Uncharacterized protein n=1 Tax=Trichonephila inaurata madagascariensis TaxID=2747483 RepID=A0A8X6XBR3_9ARAC|nr:hypothetical protein TNIN_102211 [Trichonephila inaurata madagascariensis]